MLSSGPGGITVEVLFEFLFAGMFGRLFSRRLRQQAKELQQKHDAAQRLGQPLVCEMPAAMRVVQQGPHGRGHSRWTRGVLHVEAMTLVWEPQAGKQAEGCDLTGATITRTTTVATGGSRYLTSERVTMQTAQHVVELVIRLPFLPFLRAGLQQAAIRPASHITGKRNWLPM
jgi:hypothetical protein